MDNTIGIVDSERKFSFPADSSGMEARVCFIRRVAFSSRGKHILVIRWMCESEKDLNDASAFFVAKPDPPIGPKNQGFCSLTNDVRVLGKIKCYMKLQCSHWKIQTNDGRDATLRATKCCSSSHVMPLNLEYYVWKL